MPPIASAWRIEAWARDLGHPDLPVRLEILLGAQGIGTVLACDFRADLRQAGVGHNRLSCNKCYGFSRRWQKNHARPIPRPANHGYAVYMAKG
jgi:hypothetical protein